MVGLGASATLEGASSNTINSLHLNDCLINGVFTFGDFDSTDPAGQFELHGCQMDEQPIAAGSDQQ